MVTKLPGYLEQSTAAGVSTKDLEDSIVKNVKTVNLIFRIDFKLNNKRLLKGFDWRGCWRVYSIYSFVDIITFDEYINRTPRFS